MKSNNKHTNIINLILAVFTVLSISFKSYGQANDPEDYTALRAFYLATDGDNWLKRTGWPSAADFQANPTPPVGTDMSTWWEVICEDNRVIRLIMPANNLRGSLPDMKMSKLQQLWLDLNQLSGPIPVLDMPDLEVLRASANQLTGKLPNFNMPKLNQLILEHNMLSDTIPDFDMPKMRLLSLFNNRFSGKIPDFKMKDLELLGLGKNQLSGEIPKFTHLLNDSTIIISLKDNQLSGCFPQELKRFCDKATFESNDNPMLPWLGDFTQFCTTDGSHDAQVGAPCDNGSADVIQDNCVCGILGNYCNNPDDYTALRALYLATDGDNWLKRTGWPSAADFQANPTPPPGTDMSTWWEVFCEDNRVIRVLLPLNNLRGTLPDMKMSKLQQLWLDLNQLSGPIPVLDMPDLEVLRASANQLTGKLPNFNMPKLNQLILEHNMLSDTIPDFDMPKMRLLSLFNNRFSGKIPDFKMKDLELLGLGKNQLSGEIPKFTHLLNDSTIIISLKDNQLSGCFPQELKRFCDKATFESNDNPMLPWLGDFTQFCTTDGSHDAQVGAPCDNGSADVIQDNCVCGILGNYCNDSDDYTALRALYLATDGDNWTDNTGWPTATDFLANPTPPIGTDMSQWFGIDCDGRVKQVNIENNNLIGSLPDMKLSELERFDLRNNQLSGPIPDLEMPILTFLSLSGNELSGSVPNFNMPLLEVMDFLVNKLIGSLPNFNMPELRELSFGSNMLSDTIPNFNMPKMTLLSLQTNRFTGKIPDFEMNDLEYLILSGNQLSGELPKFTHLLNDTTIVIRVNDNQLSGCFPTELKRFCARATFVSDYNPQLPWSGDFTQFCATDGSHDGQVGAPCNNGEINDEILDDCSCGQKVDNNGCNNIEDYVALRALYLATDGDNWTRRTNWPSASDFLANPTPPAGIDMSTWYGIFCEGRVTGIELEANNLLGVLPDFKMSELRYIGMDKNQLTGLIPDFNTPKLTLLRLANNNLSGPIPDFDLPLMEYIALHDNRLVGSIPNFRMKKLKGLLLNDNTLTGFVPTFSHLENDTTAIIRLSNNHLSGCYPPELKRFCARATIMTQGNLLLPWRGDFTQFCATDGSPSAQVGAPCNNGKFDDEILEDCRCGQKIIESLCNDSDDYTSLRALYLATDGDNWTNRTNWPTAAEFMANPTPPIGTDMSTWYGITCFDGVWEVDLSNNNLSGVPVYMKMLKVVHLKLQENHLIGLLPDLEMPNLQTLDLYDNQLSGIIPGYSQLTNLKYLRIHKNQLQGEIPNFNLPALEEFFAYSNDLIGSIPDFSLTKLKILTIWDNHLTGSIPDFNLPDLYILLLGQNQLTGTIPAFGNLSLEQLILSDNQLIGTIPNFNMPKLSGLDVGKNQLTGNVPTFSYLPNFDNTIIIAQNNLSGCFPQELKRFCDHTTFISDNNPLLPWQGDFSAFCATDGSHEAQIGAPCRDGGINDEILDDCSCGQKVDDNGCNNIEDYIALRALYLATDGDNWTNRTNWPTAANFIANPTPPVGTDMNAWYGIFCIGRVVSVDLRDNNLEGTLPHMAMSSLTYLLLQENKLSGSIPNFDMPQLTTLRLGFNQLSGSIPDFDLPLLERLELNHNNLNGPIPLLGKTKLSDLILSENPLGDNIPDFDLPFLVQLLINDCQLIGSIPDFKLPELQILNLKNNRLTGTIPDFNLPKLYSLSLFKNELSGSLPPFSHIDATSSTSILISDNQLSGCFPAALKKFCDQGLFVSTGNDLLPWYGSFVQFCTTDGSHEAQVGASCYRNSVIDQILDDCSCGEAIEEEDCPEAKIVFPDFPNNQTTVCTNRKKIDLAFEVTNDIPDVPAGVWWFMREDPEGTLIDISTMPATFDLVKAGVGTHTIILTYIQGDCRWSDSLQVSVIDGGLTVLEPDTIMIEKDLIATSYFLDNDILPHEPYTVSISSFPDEALNLLYFDEKGTLEVNAIKELTEDLTILYQVCDVCGDCYEGQILVLGPIDSGLTLTTLITPNAGSNNVLQFSQEPIPGAELWIFNRWGNRIYHQRNYQNDWNASGHSEGVYYYVLKVNGQTFRKTLTVVK
ncbi:MAG: gliding motility-associated C-terminal domain-containing protein [Chitinophagales bacterium]|nr:gliding motility-associated C-terminal domain-containing protein [Chitinophagales bacterium]